MGIQPKWLLVMNPCSNLLIAPSAECAVSQEATYWALKRKKSMEQLHISNCVLPFFSSMFLNSMENTNNGDFAMQWKIHYYAYAESISQDLKIHLFNFADLLLFWCALYFSTHCACPCFPMCYVWYKCWPECYWASVQNCRHLNTAAGGFPTSIIGHMQRMTGGGKAPHAILCWFTHLCIKNLSLNAEVLLTGTESSS